MAGFDYTVIVNGEKVYWTDDRTRAQTEAQKRGGVVQDHKTASAWDRMFGGIR